MIRSKLITSSVVLAVLGSCVQAFVPYKNLAQKLPLRSTTTFTTTRAFSDDDTSHSNEDYEKALINNKKRTCIQHFLSQRAFQSFNYLLAEEMKDVHTSNWIERFLDAPSLLDYHGTGALNTTRFDTSDSYFLTLAELPNEQIIIQALRNSAGAFKGGSKNNPYLKKEKDHHVEIPIDICPPSLASRIISVREQIAKEFVIDCDLIRRYNENILKSYEHRAKFMGGRRMDSCFERNSMIILESTMALAKFAPSPLRKSSYDLLLLLSLQESIHTVLRDYKRKGEEKEVSFGWLHRFYTERVESFFDGPQSYGRSDDFIEELLTAAPTIRNTEEGTALVDTQAITTDILNARSEVLLNWVDTMKRVPEEHVTIRQCVLKQQAKGWAENIASDSVVNYSDDIGAFE